MWFECIPLPASMVSTGIEFITRTDLQGRQLINIMAAAQICHSANELTVHKLYIIYLIQQRLPTHCLKRQCPLLWTSTRVLVDNYFWP